MLPKIVKIMKFLSGFTRLIRKIYNKYDSCQGKPFSCIWNTIESQIQIWHIFIAIFKSSFIDIFNKGLFEILVPSLIPKCKGFLYSLIMWFCRYHSGCWICTLHCSTLHCVYLRPCRCFFLLE